MTPQNDILPNVRYLLQDEGRDDPNAVSDPALYRWTDVELLKWINACLAVMVDMRPDLFNILWDHTCTAGAEQLCLAPRLRQVQEVTRVIGGNAVLPTQRALLDAFNPGWYLAATGAAVNWMPHPESLAKFYLDPPAAITQHVEVRLVQAHAEVGLADNINLPVNYAPAIISFVVNRAESKDDEQIDSGRANAFMSDFAGMIGANK